MVGEDIYVGPDEVLDEAVCILCSIRVDGKVREAVAILGTVRIDGEVERDTVSILGGVEVNGSVGGEAVAVLGSVLVSGTVEDNVVSVLGGLTLREGAVVGGDTVNVMGPFNRGADVEIGGDIENAAENFKPIAVAFAVGSLILLVVGVLAFGPILSALTLAIAGERRIEIVRDTLNQRLGMSFLLGVGLFFGSFILSIATQIVMFWAPVQVPIGLIMLVVSAVGYTGLSLWVGRGLVRSGSAMGAVILGSILIAFVQLIPLIGWFLLWPIFGALALGAAVLSGFGTSVDWLLPRSETEPIARPLPR